ncbi:MAG: Ribosome maturation factor RimM [Steroidobacteraceae bacterium]|nr:Ribosome maturation factor RimM [Steroidobacteraceae bacterium]
MRGFCHVDSFMDPPGSLGEFRVWQLKSAQGARSAQEVAEFRSQGARFVARLAGIETRDGAARWTGAVIEVAREALPDPGERQYYWTDLVGLAVRNVEGIGLGRVDHFIEAPANAVMVVVGEREHWVPMTRQHLVKVDRDAGTIVVDWPADF